MASATLGDRLKRIPDGETGERSDWITWLEPVFASIPALEPSGESFRVHSGAGAHRLYQLKPGFSTADVQFQDLLYARHAVDSYATFRQLKAMGTIAPSARFQVDIVPAHSVLWLYIVDALKEALDPIYNEAVKSEVEKILIHIPHHELAIQIDIASAVFARLERNEASCYGRNKSESLSRFGDIVADIANRIPSEVELLLHLCYGDANHKHAVEPTDMGDMVDFANYLVGRIRRPISLIHMPVPRDRSDEMYFAPLNRLRLGPGTELALGLVHFTDGMEGARRRLGTARKFVAQFAVATECGLGRRPPETIPKLLELMREVSDLP